MTNPNQLHWEQAISDENYNDAADIQALISPNLKITSPDMPVVEPKTSDITLTEIS